MRAWFDDDMVQLAVKDNGVGLNSSQEQRRGLGLHSALMAIAGGSFSLESRAGRYTRGVLQMPIAAVALPS